MSWLDNGHCGIVQSPSIDDLEAANFAIMRINISPGCYYICTTYPRYGVGGLVYLKQSTTTYVHWCMYGGSLVWLNYISRLGEEHLRHCVDSQV